MTGRRQALAAFHPRIADWFRRRHGSPTEIQARSWPRIRDGASVLATAPTGSGKTLCAFLTPLDHLFSGRWDAGGGVRVLYVSPLKALNNDIQRNLLEPLAELEQAWTAAGETAPRIRVATRSGDTPAADRRRMLRDPPEILVTTPESLNIMLSSAGGRTVLGGVRMAILDEIHAVAGSRRGLWLMSGIEALAELAGEFQRVALSATVRPLADVAHLVGGIAPDADGRMRPRPVECLTSDVQRTPDLRVVALDPDEDPESGQLDALAPIARSVCSATRRNRSTLVFANSRALCEKLALRINEADPEGGAAGPLAWAHHGSLSRELRMDVEARLEEGRLRAIVATSSLEMGIDIGELDEVVMVQTPPSVASAIQRAGRAGHGVGRVSRAVIHPTHPGDILEAAAVVRAALAGDIEAVRVPGPCLDVLAQAILQRLAMHPRDAEALFASVRRIAPYAGLDREHFDLVLQMLLGRYADSRVKDLQARVLEDPDRGVLQLRRGTLQALFMSGGMIPDRGYFHLRDAATGTRIGELDEEFVWENGPGRTFTLGSRQWRVQRVTHDDVLVTPAPEARHAPPFWRAGERDRDGHLARRLRELLAECEQALSAEPARLDALLAELPLDAGARAGLAGYLIRQREHTGAALPHEHHLLVECTRTGPGGHGPEAGQLVLHSFAGGRINRPWALILEERWRRRFGETPDIFAGNDAIVIQLAAGIDADTVLSLLSPEGLEESLRARLAGSGVFGARFRECAGRALLLRRNRFGERLPLWMSRLQARRLLGRVREYGDFPILLEAWRSTLDEDCDLEGLRERLVDLTEGRIETTIVHTDRPSPFAAASGWRQVNEYMYAGDAPGDGEAPDAGLRAGLLDPVLEDARLRPRLEGEMAAAFVRRRRRLEPGWGPRDALELQDWLRERRLLDPAEFEALRMAVAAGDGDWWQQLERNGRRWIVHARDRAGLERILAPRTGDRDDPLRREWLRDWLTFQPPRTRQELARDWPDDPQRLAEDLVQLEDAGALVRGALLADDESERIAEREAFEAMLRMQRNRRRGSLEPLPASAVPAFLADWQRIGSAADPVDALEALRALPLPPELWLRGLLPARCGRPPGPELDSLLDDGALRCIGAGSDRIAFVLTEELDTLRRPDPDPEVEACLRAAFPDPAARYDFEALRAVCDDDPRRAAEVFRAGFFAGRIAVDRVATLEHGIRHGFELPSAGADGAPAAPAGAHRRGSLRGRIRARVAGLPGRFARLPEPDPGSDAIDRMQRARTRARILVDRWGVVSPDLIRREARGMRWRDLFRALRLMELAGEVVGGVFLDGLDGPQFAAPEALTRIAGPRPEPEPYWLDARDPASPCGLGLPLGGLPLPARRAGAEIILAGDRCVLVSERSGRSLRIDASRDPDADAILGVLARTLDWRVPARLTVERIDGVPARTSPQLPALRRHFTVGSDHRSLLLTLVSPLAS